MFQDDGITHINVYSKSKTELGRLLSNFAHTPFTLETDGTFQSIEGYWYWLSSKDEKLRTLHGFAAKSYGQSIKAPDWPTLEDFDKKICVAIKQKIEQNQQIKDLLTASTLPFEHYYVFGPKVVPVAKGKWIIDYITRFRAELRNETISPEEKEQLIVVHSDDEIQQLIEYLQDKEYVAVDSETTGLDKDCEVVGISVCTEPNVAYYVISAIWDKDQQKLLRLENTDKIVELLKLLQLKKLITHNGVFDAEVIYRQYKIQLVDSIHTDTMCAAHLIDENRLIGLKDLAYSEFGQDAVTEHLEMKASVLANGGIWEEKGQKKVKDPTAKKKKGKRQYNKEMYKADPFILGKYGAKDALLTFRLFLVFTERLFNQKLDTFFYDETMPLFRTTTYDLNTVGIKIDVEYLNQLEKDLSQEINDLRGNILFDIQPYIKDKYPGTKKTNTFNIGSSSQIAWLLFVHLNNEWFKLTDSGREIAKDIYGKVPYAMGDKKRFAEMLKTSTNEKGKLYKLESIIKCDKSTLGKLSKKYKWVENLLKMKKADKMLNTYVRGIKDKLRYGILYPSFKQCGTVGTRYSSQSPNFMNLPRDDKRIKRAVIARPGKVLVGADYDQLEVRVFASFSKDERLLAAFKDGLDPYSIVGMGIFNKTDCIPKKEGSPEAFGVKYKKERQLAKTVMLAATYGANKFRLNDMLGDISIEECQKIIDDYFESFPKVKALMLSSHNEAIEYGVVYNLFGRPRHLPLAKVIKTIGNTVDYSKLEYKLRTQLNSSVNSKIQNTAGSIINRACIQLAKYRKERQFSMSFLIQCHDELIVECDKKDQGLVMELLQNSMENAATLPGVDLKASPKAAQSMSDLK